MHKLLLSTDIVGSVHLISPPFTLAAVARTVCDVTARYASHWCTHVRKQRLSEAWWAETLDPLSPSLEEKEEEEEDFLGKDHSLVCPASPFNVGGAYM